MRLLSRSLRPTVLRHGELLAPMEATIYHYPEPGAPPFVEVGAEVKVGQTLALLEAMKMFTDLPSPMDGVVMEVRVENGQGVKTGTPLFRIATHDAVAETSDDHVQRGARSAVVQSIRLAGARRSGGGVTGRPQSDVSEAMGVISPCGSGRVISRRSMRKWSMAVTWKVTPSTRTYSPTVGMCSRAERTKPADGDVIVIGQVQVVAFVEFLDGQVARPR